MRFFVVALMIGVVGCGRGGTRLEASAESDLAGDMKSGIAESQARAREELNKSCASRGASINADSVRWVREGECVEARPPAQGFHCRSVISGTCGNIVDNVRYSKERATKKSE